MCQDLITSRDAEDGVFLLYAGGCRRKQPFATDHVEAEQVIDHLRERGLGVDPVCRVLDLSPSTYFARKKRPKSVRRLRDQQLMPLIEEIHAESGATYGARRITRALRRKGIEAARCTVERLMRELGIEGVIRGQRRRTTVPEPSAPRPPDLVDRDFTASRPDELWVADMTYVRTWSGWAYVAFVLDVYSRMIVGWQVASHMRTELPLDALEMAQWRRRIKQDSGLIHHSDRGSQGGFNWSSQHLTDLGGCCGTRTSSCSTSGRPSTVAVTGAPAGKPDTREAAVLAKDRRGGVQRGRRHRLRCVAAAGAAVVSRGWRHAADQHGRALGPLPVVCRA
ncbi:IS3 family transposase [Streptomyces sp. ICN441]|uniref:IS3 family transposase n=1 Tax=Streptomyces sp. ICN441 TaxID=2558286 RepID=UPI001F0D6380|nr:IS3 family transposase [Streptomyces sp. ICN441]